MLFPGTSSSTSVCTLGMILKIREDHKNNQITEMCLCRVCVNVTSCSWSSFIPVCVLFHRAKLDGRSWFNLAGEMFNKIAGLVTVFSQIQAGKKVTIFIRKYSSGGE